jgi:hypothetical protein
VQELFKLKNVYPVLHGEIQAVGLKPAEHVSQPVVQYYIPVA